VDFKVVEFHSAATSRRHVEHQGLSDRRILRFIHCFGDVTISATVVASLYWISASHQQAFSAFIDERSTFKSLPMLRQAANADPAEDIMPRMLNMGTPNT
jgi:Zn-dependent oligopeptidase